MCCRRMHWLLPLWQGIEAIQARRWLMMREQSVACCKGCPSFWNGLPLHPSPHATLTNTLYPAREHASLSACLLPWPGLPCRSACWPRRLRTCCAAPSASTSSSTTSRCGWHGMDMGRLHGAPACSKVRFKVHVLPHVLPRYWPVASRAFTASSPATLPPAPPDRTRHAPSTAANHHHSPPTINH